MALPREIPVPNLIRGIEVASPSAQPGTTAFRSSINFNNIVAVIQERILAFIPLPRPSDKIAINLPVSGYLLDTK